MTDVTDSKWIEVCDHFRRAVYFLNVCRQVENVEEYNWNLLASVYSSRAIVEIVFHKIKQGFLDLDADEFMAKARGHVRRFKLIETIRVQDFHRRPVSFNPRAVSFAGPMTSKTGNQKGSLVGFSMDPKNGKLTEHKVRNASIKYDRPLLLNGLSAHDHDRDEFVQADIAVEEYLRDLKDFLISVDVRFLKSLSRLFVDPEEPNSPSL